MSMTGAFAETDDHACMLDCAIVIEKLCAHRADILPDRIAHHLRQPIRLQYFGVIVEEAQEVPRRASSREVVDGGVVVGPIV